jgi:hypothetical protein
MWKEKPIALLRYISGISLNGLKKTAEHLSQERQFSGRD